MSSNPWKSSGRSGRGAATIVLALLTLSAFGPARKAGADDGRLKLGADPGGLRVEVIGDPDDEWEVQGSEDLVTWQPLTGVDPVLSGRTNAVPVVLTGGGYPGVNRFFRARRTPGLYDPARVRVIRLTFAESNWQSILTQRYNSKSNLVGTLEMGGRTYPGVGVRYKGNSSYNMAGAKKSLNIEVDFRDPDAEVMGYRTLNLNNAFGDETIMREPLYFNVMRSYTVCPAGNFAEVHVNGVYWGLYSSAQQQDKTLIREYFPSTDGDRWRAPNIGGQAGATTGPGGGGGGVPPGGGGGGGGFASGVSALTYLGTNVARYKAAFELKSDDTTNAWARLVNATQVLNLSPAEGFRDRVEEVLAVDRWLWFLAVENLFADDDSYWNKGADYMFYFEPESGRIHPVEHDGNEAFVAGDVQLSPVQGTGNTNRPVISRLLAVPELRQRYLAHMRTVLREMFNPETLNPLIDAYSARSKASIDSDTKKGYPLSAYTNDLTALKSFVRQRHTYLTNHAELRPLAPTIVSVTGPVVPPSAGVPGVVTARVEGAGNDGVASVWLYHRGRSYGRFDAVRMLDDGAHGDGGAGDGVYGAPTTNYPAGTKVRYYVEARAANTAGAAAFFPARAEQDTESYRVAVGVSPETPVVINEVLASNSAGLADPQGEFDDWIEIRNVTDAEVDLTGRHLSDEPSNPRKWPFPAGTRIPAGGYLLVWADEDGQASVGLHASFKLSASGEAVFLTDTDARQNAILDAVEFGPQSTDRSWGRSASDASVFEVQAPSPGLPNP